MNLKLAYTELWNSKVHGCNVTDPFGHFISIYKNVSLEEFYSLSKNKFQLQNNNRKMELNIVNFYNKNEYILTSIFTYRLRIFQKLWRTKFYKINKWLD